MERVYSKEEYSKAYTELLIILKSLAKEDLKKIPRETLEFYIKNSDRNHKFKYEKNISFKEQNIMHLTIILFANLYLEYWASDKRKEEIKKQDRDELIRIEAKKQELYSVDNLFKKSNENVSEENNQTAMIIVEKKSIFTRVREWLRKFFKKLT